MEVQFPFSLFLFFASLLFFFLIFFRFRSQNRLDTNKKLPPQPWKLPIVGHMQHLVGAPPLQVLANLSRKLGPIFHLQLGEVSAIVISSPTIAKEILKTHDISFSSRPKLLTVEIVAYNYAGVAFSAYGPYWRQMRKISIVELLSAKKVRSFRPLRERESWNLVESISMDISKTINLSEKISTLINMIICKVAIGNRCDAYVLAKLLALIEEIVKSASGFSVSDLFPSIKVLHLITGTRSKLMKIHRSMDVLLDDIISEHKEHRARIKSEEDENQDLLDILMKLKDDGGLEVPLTSDNIKAVILDMIVAGNDTSAATISWAISELIKNPRVMKKLQLELRNTLKRKEKIHESDIEKLEYLKLVIMETLRLHPPLPLLLPRECREECDIGGYHIPAKTKVIINVWRLGRDPDNWIDPESFKPERFSEISKSMMGGDFELLPFGAGRRMCPGMSLGLANVELPLVMLLYHFNWELPNGARFEDLDMSETLGSSLKRKNPLLLVPTHYKHHE